MTEYVVFTLAAPMGSFGDLAGHERRGSGNWPRRSAILGLVGAAMGILRDDKDGLERLREWRVAVSKLTENVPLQDFHTVQSVPTTRIKRPDTRRDALNAGGAVTTLTYRDYRCDCAFGVALWGGANIQGLVDALKKPTFVPYLGRKSCPLAVPMAPEKVVAEDVVAALKKAVPPLYLTDTKPLLIASDDELPSGWQETVWDEPLDRELWHFGPRTVHVSSLGEQG